MVKKKTLTLVMLEGDYVSQLSAQNLPLTQGATLNKVSCPLSTMISPAILFLLGLLK